MKKLVLFNLMLLVMSGILNAQIATKPAGSGTSGNPYQIETLENLYWITTNRTEWTKYFIQIADIDASASSEWSTGWLPIGDYYENSAIIRAFSGNYDGQGHTISGLNISYNAGYVAFGFIGCARGAVVKNLGVTNVNVNGGNSSAGGLIGYAIGVTTSNCFSTGNVVANNVIGGLIGSQTSSSSATNCYSTCNVSGTGQYIGGLVGHNNYSTIIYSYYETGTVNGSGSSATNTGGLVGFNFGAVISKCYSFGTVNGYNCIGGLVGLNTNNAVITDCFSRSSCSSNPTSNLSGGLVGENYEKSSITNCYSTGSVSEQMKGMIGYQSLNSTTVSSFWDTETSGTTIDNFGTGKTTYQMKLQSTFTGWDFTTIWGINIGKNDGYPYFMCTDATLALSLGSNIAVGCVNAAITPIVYNVGGGASGVIISPTLPNGLSGTYNSVAKTFTISGIPTVAGVYSYTITTTGTPFNCSEANTTGTITVNPLPEVQITDNNSPICEYANAEFYLEGTPGAEVTYSFDGGTTTRTVILAGGTATAIYDEASSEVNLSLVSIKNNSTGCNRTLNSTSKVTVITTTASISGAHIACNSTTLTAVTNASDPTYYWATFNGYDWVKEGEGPTLEVTRPEDYYLFVYDGITGCDQQSDPFTVTFIPEPEVQITGNNSPICKYENPEFYLEGTPGAEVTYSFDGGTTTWTVPLTGGTGKAINTEASSEVTLSLITIKIPSTGCIKALTSTSTVTVNNPPTVSISGAHNACGSTTLTAVTNASSPTYGWYTYNDEGDGEWMQAGEGSTLEVTQSDNYWLMVTDGSTKCDNFSDPFEVTVNRVKVSPIASNITESESVTLTAMDADTYSWSPATGLNTTTGAIVIAKPDRNTTYTVTGSTGGCITSASSVISVQETCRNAADQYETNNSMTGNLFTIPLDLTISANILNSKDVDWYKLEIAIQAKYTLNCFKVNGTLNPAVELYGSNGRRLKSIDRAQPNSYNLAIGTYYIKVSAGVKTYLCYTLEVVNEGATFGAIASFDETKSAEIEQIPEDICKIWPNPTSNEFKFYNGMGIPVQLRIIDVTGRQIEFFKNVGIAETIAFGTGYKPGIYFVETNSNETRQLFKVMKQQ